MADVKKKDQTPDSARTAAVKLLYSVLEEGAYSNLSSLKILNEIELDSRDRAFASAAVYGTVSWLPTIDWYLQQVSDKKINRLNPWIRTILRIGIWQLKKAHSVTDAAAVDESVKLARFYLHAGGASYVNAVLRNIIRQELVIPRKLEAFNYGLPTWMFGLFKKWYGYEQAVSLAESFLENRPWTVLRVNVLAAQPQLLIDAWKTDGLEAEPGYYLPEAARLKLSGNSLRDLAAWQDGLLTAQDEAAMLTAHIAAPSPHDRIIDLCAAPGGKTTHLAELSSDMAEITALELQEHRAVLISEQADRLGLQSINVITGDAVSYGRNKSYDIVLADVPCSGLGLLGRKPELRINMSYERIQEMIRLQRQILQNAARITAEGGYLIYSTCTINPQENIEQIEWLLKYSDYAGSFMLEDFSDLLPADLSKQDSDLQTQAREGSIQLLPNKHKTDGFFIARLKRV